MDYLKILGDNIRSLRLEKELTQEQLAVRPHSGIGWKSPNDFEKNLCLFPAA